MKCTRKDLSDRLEVLNLKQQGLSQSQIASPFGCSSSQDSHICTNVEKIIIEAEGVTSCSRKKRAGKAKDVEDALFVWFKDARARNAPISTLILEDKSKQLAEWNPLSQRQDCCPDGRSVTASDGTLAERSEKVAGGKKARDRITALVATNMDGSDKRPLLIIGKSLHPRGFRGIAHKPLSYKANTNAWMTEVLGQLAGFRAYLEQHGGSYETFYSLEREIEAISVNSKKQKTMTLF
ncbi:hypothetical protein CAPTEDRAFT_209678 [Capitella teleta]|uniref:Uncharacterized protein n=1 Tax=Capitella teleta TaxID=283909 RepID=R7UVS9_CAPTE|nr:hypothetical protein CAPTEDRAFT_209678 [Capitella teleta]|eukprot:ELU10434.1 hypothetical protein CAPTEDRAFT_209678 [Capitella teleta]